MGRGNVCTLGKYEGLYYIDNDDFMWYYNEEEDESAVARDLEFEDIESGAWEYDEIATREELDDLLDVFTQSFIRRFPSFEKVETDHWISPRRNQKVLMENGLFYVVIEDNEWSVAVELIQKEDSFGNLYYGLQKRHYQEYLDGIRDSLLEWIPQVSTYGGAWSSGTVRREDVESVLQDSYAVL